MGTFWNVYAFYVLYAEIDGFDPTGHALVHDSLSVMDRWLLSRLNSMVKSVDGDLELYRVTEAAKALDSFTDELSNWYVRRGRERYWAHGLERDKINAYLVLYSALVTLAKASSPMVPFICESVYQNLVRSVDRSAPLSVHLCPFPAADEKLIVPSLEAEMDAVLKIVTTGRAGRNAANIKTRQPLAKMYVKSPNTPGLELSGVIKDELNVKEIEFMTDMSGFVSYAFKPRLKTLGPKYGSRIGEIREKIAALDGASAKKELEETGSLNLGVLRLLEDDLLIETVQKEGFYSLSDGFVTVALDIRLTPELIEEGFVREIISKLQTMRKEADFNVTDHIAVRAAGSEKLLGVIRSNIALIKGDVLAESMEFREPRGYVKEWDINGERIVFGVERAE
jgi:isoleucyl-tRNA synthetase